MRVSFFRVNFVSENAVEFEKALEILKGISFFDDLSLEEKKFIATLDCHRVIFEKSQTIIKQGEIDSALYILLEGKVRVVRKTDPQTTLAKLAPGAVFGEVSLISSRPRTTSVLADKKAVVLKMDGQMIERLNPILLNKIKNQIIRLLINRLDAMNEKVLQRSRKKNSQASS